MITIEPAPKTSRAGALRKRELARFVSGVASSIELAGEVSVLLAGDERIRELNHRFRGQNHSTDVLSFPAAPHFSGHLSGQGHAGDLAISLEAAARQAGECGHTLEIEVKVLLLHGLLHLAGYDHETDSGEMARKETMLRKKLALPLGLIERERPPARPGAGVGPARRAKGAVARQSPPARGSSHRSSSHKPRSNPR
jgi:probable rRNA maturation factor